MTLNEFATFSTAISGLAVTASLVYLALQTHQNAKHSKALIHQGRLANIMDMTSAFLDPELTALMIKKNGQVPTADLIGDAQFAAIFMRLRFSWEDSYSQFISGLLSADAFATTRERIANNLSLVGFRNEWERNKVRGTAFTAYVEAILATLPPAEPWPASPAG